jgi:hypothetical protein
VAVRFRGTWRQTAVSICALFLLVDRSPESLCSVTLAISFPEHTRTLQQPAKDAQTSSISGHRISMAQWIQNDCDDPTTELLTMDLLDHLDHLYGHLFRYIRKSNRTIRSLSLEGGQH